MRHARNQVGETADAVAARGTQELGWCTKGGGAKTAWSTLDAARHAAEGRPPISAPGHDPSSAGASITSIGAGVRGAARRDRAGVVRSIPGDPLFDPAGPRALHRRGG